jgi:hypothetical protein
MELSDATEKAPAIPGIDPGTFRLVAQCLNHYATPGPRYYSKSFNIIGCAVYVIFFISALLYLLKII